MKKHHHRNLLGVGYLVILLLLLTYNYLTPFIGDDFYYMFSFADGTRIRSLGDIVTSMVAHSQIMNGRWAAHTLVQFFGMFPPFVFDIVNAVMFTAYIALMYRISTNAGSNPILMPLVFCVVWLYQPGFSDSILWQDGACNYLWSVVFGLLFIRRYVDLCIYGRPSGGWVGKTVFVILSFPLGAYSENVSAACIFMGMLALGWQHFCRKEKVEKHLILALILAFAGYVSIYLAPAQWANKATGMNLVGLLTSFVEAVIMYRSFGVLCGAFVVLLIVNIKEKTQRDTIALALLFLAGSLAANFIMTFAAYYHPRSATGAFCFLLVADLILLQAIFQNVKFHTAIVCVLAVTILATVPALAEATRDIGKTYIEVRQNEAYIEACKAQGILDVEVPIPTASRTDYCVTYGGYYMGEGVNYTMMAKYYGLNSLYGVQLPERILDESAYQK